MTDSRTLRALMSRLNISGQQGGQSDWPAIEANLGLPLPDDIKQLIETFPDGHFQGLMRPIRPGLNFRPETDFLGTFEFHLEDMRGWRAGGQGTFPHPIFPEPAGLLPWASGRGGQALFWLTAAKDPNEWPVVVADNGFNKWRTIPGTATEFLLQVIEGNIDPSDFGVDPPYSDVPKEPLFQPIGQPTTAQAPMIRDNHPGLPYWSKPGTVANDSAR